MAFLLITCFMVRRAYSFIPPKIIIWVVGRIIRRMVLDNFITTKVLCIRGNGLMTTRMGLDRSIGLMGHTLKGILKKAVNRQGSSFGLITIYTKESLLIMNFQERVNLLGRLRSLTKVNGGKT